MNYCSEGPGVPLNPHHRQHFCQMLNLALACPGTLNLCTYLLMKEKKRFKDQATVPTPCGINIILNPFSCISIEDTL